MSSLQPSVQELASRVRSPLQFEVPNCEYFFHLSAFTARTLWPRFSRLTAALPCGHAGDVEACSHGVWRCEDCREKEGDADAER
jgi:hypothetical protein